MGKENYLTCSSLNGWPLLKEIPAMGFHLLKKREKRTVWLTRKSLLQVAFTTSVGIRARDSGRATIGLRGKTTGRIAMIYNMVICFWGDKRLVLHGWRATVPEKTKRDDETQVKQNKSETVLHCSWDFQIDLITTEFAHIFLA